MRCFWTSVFHLTSWRGDRGFSLLTDGPLDMRMDPGSALTAAEIVNEWPQDELADTLYRYGEEYRSRRLAAAIVKARPLDSTLTLAEVISRAAGGKRGERTHPATQSFQALRIAVNDELGALEAVLPQIVGLLAPGGRIAVITFHSLEDRIVKQFIQREARDCICDLDSRARQDDRGRSLYLRTSSLPASRHQEGGPAERSGSPTQSPLTQRQTARSRNVL